MPRPLPITLLAIFAVFNGAGLLVLSGLAFLGNKVIWIAGGLGPQRVAIADLFGPLRAYTPWILLAIALLMLTLGYGFYKQRPWARVLGVLLFGTVALATLVAIGWGIRHQEYGVVIGGVVKVCLELGLCWYLLSWRAPASSLPM